MTIHIRCATDPDTLEAGIRVALAAKHATGFPLDADPETLQQRLRKRQTSAAAIWVAHTSEGEVVGHALVAYIDDTHPLWGTQTDPHIVAARAQGRLLELGGLVVHPDHHGQGIATALTQTRLAWARDHHAYPVSVNWNQSPGSAALGRRHGKPIGHHPDHPLTLHDLTDHTPEPLPDLPKANHFVRDLLDHLPRRYTHSLGVATTAQRLANHLPARDRHTLVTAALLHDIGYARPHTGHHAIDGAHLLTGTPYQPVAPYVAWHSTSAAEATQRNLTNPFPRPTDPIADLLWIADFTTSPDGHPVTPAERHHDIRNRYQPDSPVIRALDASHDEFLACLNRHHIPYDTAQATA